jgi:putative endonuclease
MYVLFNPSTGKYYIGITDNLKRRLGEHRSGNNRSTKYQAASWRLVYAELYASQIDARRRELRLKSHGSGLMELRKRIANSLEVVSKTGDGER